MRRISCRVALLGVLLVSCKGGGGTAPPVASSSAAAVAVAAPTASPPGALSPEGCLTAPDYLVPLQKYGDNDLIRAVLVDGDQVFFRNMRDLMRVPLSGGPVVPVGKAPALSLRGTTELWSAGDELLTQSSGEPIFMKSKKSGGEWTSFIDLTAAKKGGGRDVATRILQGIGRASPPAATAAAFDGKAFYYAEITRGKGRNAPSASVLKSVALGGGEPRTLFETPGDISEVTVAGDQLAFHLVLPPTAEQLAKAEADRKKNKFAFGVSGENWLMAVPLAGGAGKRLMRLSSIFSGGLMGTSTILGADGSTLYVSGYADEDLTKPGVYRLAAAGGAPEQLDKRFLRGNAYVAGDRIVIVATGTVEPGKPAHAALVLTVPRQGKSLTLAACVAQDSSLHASALAGNTVLLSLFQQGARIAGIAKVALK